LAGTPYGAVSKSQDVLILRERGGVDRLRREEEKDLSRGNFGGKIVAREISDPATKKRFLEKKRLTCWKCRCDF